VLDAVNKHLAGASVLVVEKSSSLGGAWKSLELFEGVVLENAVHYLMPSQKGYNFLQKYLDIQLSQPGSKKFYVCSFLFQAFVLDVRSPFYRTIVKVLINLKNLSIQDILKNLFTGFISSNIAISRYPIGGSMDILSRISKLVQKTFLNIVYLSEVESIVDDGSIVTLKVNSEYYTTSRLIVSQGFVFNKPFIIQGEKTSLKLLRERRPSLHIKLVWKSAVDIAHYNFTSAQFLFPFSSTIKYCHDLNGFSSNQQTNALFFVLALNNNMLFSEQLIHKVVLEFISLLPLPNKKNIVNYSTHWQDIFLPPISKSEANRLTKSTQSRIKVLLTEEFCTSLGTYSEKWYHLKDYLKAMNNQ